MDSCLWCAKERDTACKLKPHDPRVCPLCDHEFKGKGWDGIDAHWRSKHGAVMRYEEFWNALCPSHRG